jgi:Flp pilus assembly protein TadD
MRPAASYDDHIGLAKRFITQRHFEAAGRHARRAMAEDASRPDAFNLLGVLYEVAGNRAEALKHIASRWR